MDMSNVASISYVKGTNIIMASKNGDNYNLIKDEV